MSEEKLPLHKRLLKKRKFRVVLFVLLVLLAVRIALPYIILRYANRELNELPGYRGHINDIDIALIRGAYVVDEIYLNKLDSVSGEQTEFFRAGQVDLSVEWKSLFKGEIAGEVIVTNPELRFTKDKAQPEDVSEDTTNFREVIKDLMPLNINRFEVINGKIKYVDDLAKPRVDVAVTNINIVAENLTNKESQEALPAKARASASLYGGTVNVNLKMDPLAKARTFDLNAEIKDVQLKQLNDFFKAYGKLDINKGTFGLYTEAAAKQGNFVGYVKPVIKDLDILGPEDKDNTFLQKLWESLAGGVGVIFRNQPHDQLATKIPFEGNIDKPDTKLWYAVWLVLRNAFIEALRPAIEHEINLKSIDPDKTFYEGILSPDEKDKDDKKNGFLKKIFKKDKDKEKSNNGESEKEQKK